MTHSRRWLALSLLLLAFGSGFVRADSPLAATRGGALPGPLPLFPASNWWNLDISAAPVDPNSAAYINFIGGATRSLRPDLGGDVEPGSDEIYGIPYIVVDSTQPKRMVTFEYADESDGVGQLFYPIPDEAITQARWIEGGPPGNQDVGGDRHILIVDSDNKFLYELFAAYHDGTGWRAGSGAFFDMKTNNRRPEGWTSADAAGLAILPGLLRYEEVTGAAEIGHAFRVTVQQSNGHVYPASHRAGSTSGALPMGARLRLKASKDISTFTPEVQRIFRAMKKHGLIVADNGSNMFVTGTYDNRWESLSLVSRFSAIKASDFEVVQLGYNPPPPPVVPALSVGDVSMAEGPSGVSNATFTVSASPAPTQAFTVAYATTAGSATASTDYAPVSGILTFAPGVVSNPVNVPVLGDRILEGDETFSLTLSGPSGATLADGTGIGTIVNDDAAGLSLADTWTKEPPSGTATANTTKKHE